MPPPGQLTQWQELLRENLPQLSRPQLVVLAMFSFAVASIGHCGLTSVATYLALLLEAPFGRLRQRLREFYKPAVAKSGRSRRDLDVSCCFAALLGWCSRLSRSNRLALALDATTLSDRFTILTISVLYRATAIPVAWSVLPGNCKGAWKPHWLRLLRLLSGALPQQMVVIVCADRGLYAKWLFQAICDCGWHPMLRVNDQGSFTSSQDDHYVHFSGVIGATDQPVSLSGVAFSKHPIGCTLLAVHATGYRDPWLIVTDLPTDQATVQWYALRGWIEQGFKAIKSAGMQWQRTRMSDPKRAERLWLVLSVATLLLALLATRQEDHERLSDQQMQPTQSNHTQAIDHAAAARRPRRLRLQHLGHLVLAALLCANAPLGQLYLQPEPWLEPLTKQQPLNVNEHSTIHPP